MKPIIVAALLLAVATAVWLGVASKETPPIERKHSSIVVNTFKVQPFNYEETLSLSGTALANESVELTAQISDIVAKIHFTEGAFVEKDQTLVTLKNAEEKAQIRSAQAVLNDAQADFKRTLELAKQNAVSSAVLDNARAQLEVAKTQKKSSTIALKEHAITAPFAGTLGARDISVGSYLEPGDRITTLDSINPIKIDIYVPERYIAFVHKGQHFTAESIAFDQTFEGTISVVESRIDPASRSFRARGIIDNDDLLLKPGLLLHVTLQASTQSVLAVPEEALLPIAKKQYIYIIDENSLVAARREVRIGRRFDGLVEITRGITSGDLVVTEGQLKLSEGQAVSIADIVTNATE